MSEDLVLGAVDARVEPEAIIVRVELVNRSDRTVHAYRSSRGLGYESASRTLRIRLTDRGSQAMIGNAGSFVLPQFAAIDPHSSTHDRAAPPAYDHPDRRRRRPRRARSSNGCRSTKPTKFWSTSAGATRPSTGTRARRRHTPRHSCRPGNMASRTAAAPSAGLPTQPTALTPAAPVPELTDRLALERSAAPSLHRQEASARHETLGEHKARHGVAYAAGRPRSTPRSLCSCAIPGEHHRFGDTTVVRLGPDLTAADDRLARGCRTNMLRLRKLCDCHKPAGLR